jgi:hypothetical protein
MIKFYVAFGVSLLHAISAVVSMQFDNSVSGKPNRLGCGYTFVFFLKVFIETFVTLYLAFWLCEKLPLFDMQKVDINVLPQF